MRLPSLRQFIFIVAAAILLGHFFISLGRSETIFDLLGQSWYYSDLFFVSIIVFVVTTFVATVHYTLDARLPITAGLPRRFMLQGIIGVFGPAMLSLMFTFVYMEFVLDQDIFETSFLVYEFPISVVVIFAINLIFVITTLLKPTKKGTRSIVLVNQGDKKLALQVSNIAGVSKEGDYTLISTFDEKQYVSSETLEELTATLPPSTFFRANRQWIVHRLTCGSFTTERSGKLDLALKTPINRSISVSQKRAQEFKAWLKAATA